MSEKGHDRLRDAINEIPPNSIPGTNCCAMFVPYDTPKVSKIRIIEEQIRLDEYKKSLEDNKIKKLPYIVSNTSNFDSKINDAKLESGKNKLKKLFGF